MQITLPSNLAEWEAVLTRYFLITTGEHVEPIRSFDISPETLALAAGADPSASDQVVTAFKEALLADRRTLYSALERGAFNRKLVADSPGCFTYLALTVFVDSQLNGGGGSHQFRPKLAAFLETNRKFSNLSGIASMWETLRDWLARQAKCGRPFRKLVLPNGDGWVQIGHSLRLSFPSRRDYTFLGNFFDQHPEAATNERAMLDMLRILVDKSNASPGLRDAFDEFHHAQLSGQRTLADHRFWKFVLSVATSRNLEMPVDVSLEIYPEEDGFLQYRIRTTGRLCGDSVHSTLQSAVGAIKRLGPSNLRKVVEAGYVIFKRIGTARWMAVPRFSDCQGEVKVGLCHRLTTTAGSKLNRLQASGDWSITVDPVPIARAEDVLYRQLSREELPSIISQVNVTGGVRTSNHWLGRRTVLPRIVTDLGTPIFGTYEDTDATPICEEVEPNLYAIKAKHPLSGAYELTCSPMVETRVRFVANSFIHEPQMPKNVVDAPEWNDTAELSSSVAEPPFDWDDIPEALDDLIEAIYAGGRCGWNESDLISLLEGILPKEINSWDFLRSLHEASTLKPFLRARFRGRTWGLEPATLVPLRSATQNFVLVDGCVSALQLADFRFAVEAIGGRTFRRIKSRWSIPIVGAIGAPIDPLAERLGWQTKQAVAPGRRPAALHDAQLRRLDAYQCAFSWSWEMGRFVADEPRTPVRLARWVHMGGRDHDLYVVSGPTLEKRFLSRCSAIVYAHMLAHRAMYRFENDALIRIGQDGFLPDHLSQWLRYKTLTNAEPSSDGGYVYRAQNNLAMTIAALLPGAVEADVTAGSSWNVIANARRKGLPDRLVFTGGHFVSGRTPFNLRHGSN